MVSIFFLFVLSVVLDGLLHCSFLFLLIMIHGVVSDDSVRCRRLSWLVGLASIGFYHVQWQGILLGACTAGLDVETGVHGRCQ